MKRDDHVLAKTTWKKVKDTKYDVAILPWGATEAHNYHLPYGTDCFQSAYIAEKSAEAALKRGVRAMVLPCVPFGVQTAQIDVKFNINMMPSTQPLVLRDIVQSLELQGVEKLIILNGHGGNNFVPMIRELYLEFKKIKLFSCNWYDCVDAKEYFNEPGDHGGELETSTMMCIEPALVLPLSESGSGKTRRLKVPLLSEGWAWAQRGWLREVTEDTGAGNPRQASAEKGQRYLEAVIGKITQLITEVAALDLKNSYE